MANRGPFRADHVGSLLRPERLHNARKSYKEGTITHEQLREVETEVIKRDGWGSGSSLTPTPLKR